MQLLYRGPSPSSGFRGSVQCPLLITVRWWKEKKTKISKGLLLDGFDIKEDRTWNSNVSYLEIRKRKMSMVYWASSGRCTLCPRSFMKTVDTGWLTDWLVSLLAGLLSVKGFFHPVFVFEEYSCDRTRMKVRFPQGQKLTGRSGLL